jgi:streptogramin lyase
VKSNGEDIFMPGITKRIRVALSVGAIALAVLATMRWSPHTTYAAGQGALLTGAVRSASGEKMGGVSVSAKIEGRTITASVFTDEGGDYYFPPMEEGKYRVWAQAAGYEKAQSQVDLKGPVVHQNLVMKETKDFVLQLSGDQLIAALPEDTAAHRRMKDTFIRNCTTCHEGNVSLQNRFDAQGWEAIINAMSRIEAYGSFREGQQVNPTISYFKKDLASYLAEMRGPGASPIEWKAPQRPSGEAALPVVYEYDLPLEGGGGYILNNGSDWSLGPSMASGGGLGLHDAQVDFDGNIWFTYNQKGSLDRTIGKVDAKTGQVTNFKAPGANGVAGLSHGITLAHDGILWFNVDTGEGVNGKVSGSLGRMDPKTGTLEVYTPPKGMAGVERHVDEDGQGYIWGATEAGALRFNPKTHEFKEYKSLTLPGRSYGVAGDREGNGWWTQIDIDIIGHSDIESGKSLEIKLPPANSSTFLKAGDLSPEDLKAYAPWGAKAQTPRRPAADKQSDDVWVPNYSGNNLMRINSRTLKVTYYPAPRVGLNPYMPGIDKSHNVWMSLQNTDDIAKFDPQTGKWTFYTWPSRGTGLRTFHLVERDGVLQLAGAYFNANRVSRMVVRTRKDVAALKTQVQEMARAR